MSGFVGEFTHSPGSCLLEQTQHPPLRRGGVVSGVLCGDAAECVSREDEGGDDIRTIHTSKYIPDGM